MDALKLLEEDHDRFKELLERGEETTERARVGRRELFQMLKRELEIHERMEEEVLYPALKEHPKAKDIVLEGYEEHHVADMIVAELAETDYADERWGAKWKVLKESLEHHIEEEETTCSRRRGRSSRRKSLLLWVRRWRRSGLKKRAESRMMQSWSMR